MAGGTPILEIVYGTTHVNLLGLSGFHLDSWRPRRAPFRNVWGQGAMAGGRQLDDFYRENITSQMTFQVSGNSQDEVAATRQQLDQILLAAKKYWTTSYAPTPVYLAARGHHETNTRYAIIKDYDMPDDDEAYGNPFANETTEVVQRDIVLTLEHTLWRDVPPGEETEIEIAGESGGYGRSAHTGGEAYVTNYQRTGGQITHIYQWTAAGGYSANLQGAAKPTTLFPAPVAVDDALYFGSFDAFVEPPFSNLVFDLSGGAIADLIWEYWDGAAWTTVSSFDLTDGLMNTGVYSLAFLISDDWTKVAVNAVTGWWIRARIRNAAGFVSPVQNNRDIYTAHWPRIAIDEAEVAGDLPALTKYEMRIAANAYLSVSRLYTALRSKSRGTTYFQPFINLCNTYNPLGVTVTAMGAGSSAIAGGSGNTKSSPTGKYMSFTAGTQPWTEEFGVTIQSTVGLPLVCQEWVGQYHVYLRYRVTSGTDGDLRVRLNIREGQSGDAQFTGASSALLVGAFSAYQGIVDLGIINLPLNTQNSYENSINYWDIRVEIENASVSARTAYFYDLVLLPCDEKFVIAEMIPLTQSQNASAEHTKIVIDSTTPTQNGVIAKMVTDDESAFGFIYGANWLYRGIDPFCIQANADQEIYTLMEGYYTTSSDLLCMQSAFGRPRMWSIAQYESMRGAS